MHCKILRRMPQKHILVFRDASKTHSVLRAFEKHTFATKIKQPDASHAFLNKHMGALRVSRDTKMCF